MKMITLTQWLRPHLTKFTAAVAVGAVLAASSATAALQTYHILYSGAAFGNGATAEGTFTVDDTVFTNPGSFDGFGGGINGAIVDVTLTVSGASSGNGTFTAADFGNGYYLTIVDALDLNTEWVGQPQPTPGTTWGDYTLGGSDTNDLNFFGTTPGAPTGDFFFVLGADGDTAEKMALVSVNPNVLTAPPGNYAVLIEDPMFTGTTKTTGFLRGTVTDTIPTLTDPVAGHFTGSAYWQSFQYPVSADFDALTERFTATFPAKNKPHRMLTLSVTRHGQFGGLDGMLTDGTTVTPFASRRPAGKLPTGKITGLFFPGRGIAASDAVGPISNVPLGTGWFSGTITSDGGVRYAGRMPDGRHFTGASFVNDLANFAAYNEFPRYDGRGSFFGAIGASSKGVSFAGLRLQRPASQIARYGNGFAVDLTAVSAYYFAPSAGQPIVDFGSATPNVNLALFNGNMPSSTTPATFSGADALTFPSGNPRNIKLTTDRTNGLFNATFNHPTLGLKKISGAFVQGRGLNLGATPNGFNSSGLAGGVFKGLSNPQGVAGGLNFNAIAPPPVRQSAGEETAGRSRAAGLYRAAHPAHD